MKRLLVVFGSAFVLMGIGAGGAFAGEVTGNGKPTAAPDHANSVCSFSGQNDQTPGEGPVGPRTQTPADGPAGAPGHGLPGVFPDGCRGGSL